MRGEGSVRGLGSTHTTNSFITFLSPFTPDEVGSYNGHPGQPPRANHAVSGKTPRGDPLLFGQTWAEDDRGRFAFQQKPVRTFSETFQDIVLLYFSSTNAF